MKVTLTVQVGAYVAAMQKAQEESGDDA